MNSEKISRLAILLSVRVGVLLRALNLALPAQSGRNMKRLLFITIVLACAASAGATTFVVNSLGDPNPGDGTCDVANCTLREAMNAANANPGPDTITFSVSGTIFLNPGPAPFDFFPIVTSDMTIDGSGQAVTIDGSNRWAFTNVSLGATLTLQRLTVNNGRIQNFGTLNVLNSTFTSQSSLWFYGTNIYSAGGTVNVTDSTFFGNVNLGDGGAIYACAGSSTTPWCSPGSSTSGTLTVTRSNFSANRAGFGFQGGAIHAFGTQVTIVDSTFEENGSSRGPNNSAPGGNGGAIYIGFDFGLGGSLRVTGSTFEENYALQGGAIHSFKDLTVSNSTFYLNVATGITGTSFFAGAGGAILAAGSVLYNTEIVSLVNNTFANNLDNGLSLGAALQLRAVTATLTNNLFVGNASQTCYLTPNTGDSISGNNNLADDGSCGSASVTTVKTAVELVPDGNPVIADNGGPTKTMALQPGSFAIDNGDLTACSAAPVSSLDQRGAPRPYPSPGQCDVGAYEYGATLPTTTTTTTAIHSAAHAVVTTVAAGSTVHDSVTVTGVPPAPTGNVTIDWFTNSTCAGSPAATSAAIALGPGGTVDATGFPQGPLAAGLYGFRAHYAGDGTHNPSDGACEPLRVVDANIQIAPSGTNRVGEPHTFTGHVNVNDGSGAFANAPDGTQISFNIASGPGSFTSANPCTTAGGTGSCQITLTSATAGVTTVSAQTTLSVGGVSLTRSTNGVGANSGPAWKIWGSAKIAIAPSTANAVGQPHTFTVTLLKDLGDGNGFVAAAGEHVDVTLTDANGAAHTAPTGTCTTAGANTDAAGQCTITFTSPTAGTVTGHASSTLSVGGSAPFTVATDGTGGNSGDAVKTFVDARITLSPLTATNGINQSHVVAALVEQNPGTGWVAAPNGTSVTFSLLNNTANASFVGGNTCTTTLGSCTVTITGTQVGGVDIQGTTTFSVGGVSVTRTTGDGVSGDSAHAHKTYVSGNIIIKKVTVPAGDPQSFTFTPSFPGGTFALTDQQTKNSGPLAPGSYAVSETLPPNWAQTGATCSDGSPVTAIDVAAGETVTCTFTNTRIDARITLSPAEATNPVNQAHVVTALVQQDTGSGFVPAPDGTVVTFSLLNNTANASFVGGVATCTTAGGTGQCTVSITAPQAGAVDIRGTTTFSVLGASVTRTTGDGVSGDSWHARKVYLSIGVVGTSLVGAGSAPGFIDLRPPQ